MKDPEKQEQHFTQLFHIVNNLKRKVEEQMKQETPPSYNFDEYKSKLLCSKAKITCQFESKPKLNGMLNLASKSSW